eukprot:scaffold124174_cov48-Phaeocystis_antarctica.AAC.1
MKAELPAHAQRINSLLAWDREDALCRAERKAYDIGARCGLAEARAAGDGGASKQRAGEGSTAGWGQGTWNI